MADHIFIRTIQLSEVCGHSLCDCEPLGRTCMFLHLHGVLGHCGLYPTDNKMPQSFSRHSSIKLWKEIFKNI